MTDNEKALELIKNFNEASAKEGLTIVPNVIFKPGMEDSLSPVIKKHVIDMFNTYLTTNYKFDVVSAEKPKLPESTEEKLIEKLEESKTE